MAVETGLIKQAYGVTFTVRTANSADWAAVANDTRFYDIADDVVYFKNSGGTIISLFDTGGSGPFGISDSAGVYTYYATLTLAFAAASAGDVVEQFADVTENDILITVPLNVHWNLNGHEYKKTGTGSTHSIKILGGSTNHITNGRITIEGIAELGFDAGTASHVYGDGLIITSNGNKTVLGIQMAGANASHFYNMTIIQTGSTNNATRWGSFYNCVIKNEGTAICCLQPYDMDKCYISADNYITISSQQGHASGCTVLSYGSTCMHLTARLSNCYVHSFAGSGVGAFTADINNCTIKSDAGSCEIYSAGSTIRNSTIVSVSSSGGIRTTNGAILAYNNTIENSAGVGIEVGANSEWIDNTIIVTFNSVAGHGAKIANGITAGNEPEITACKFKIANTSANYLNAGGATRANFSDLGSFDKLVVSTPVNANITQGITRLTDAQGNNL